MKSFFYLLLCKVLILFVACEKKEVRTVSGKELSPYIIEFIDTIKSYTYQDSGDSTLNKVVAFNYLNDNGSEFERITYTYQSYEDSLFYDDKQLFIYNAAGQLERFEES